MPLPTQHENPAGLHQRYVVYKANGKYTDPAAIYFVLRLDDKSTCSTHVKASRKAARTWCECVLSEPQSNLTQTALDLTEMLDRFDGVVPAKEST